MLRLSGRVESCGYCGFPVVSDILDSLPHAARIVVAYPSGFCECALFTVLIDFCSSYYDWLCLEPFVVNWFEPECQVIFPNWSFGSAKMGFPNVGEQSSSVLFPRVGRFTNECSLCFSRDCSG